MFKFAGQQFPRRLLGFSKWQADNLARSTIWTHAAPLSLTGSNSKSSHHHLQKCYVLNLHSKTMLHTTSRKNNIDLMDEAKKRYKHMLSLVDWKEVKNSPQPALAYGAGGLIPFVLPPLAILLNGEFLPNLAFVQLAYGASILSFLGGVKWGFAVPENTPQKLSWENLGQSVSLSLVGFGSLILPPWMGTITLIAGLGASTYIDITSQGYPQWFKAMRLCLSGVAIGSLGFGLLLRILY
ncbi:Transmembrane protein 69 [Frankliniella fusca]|uniref:Transmembrane protein 69 n=1 Tax=Frankliniella fusca TaxID=407009 RepID=A0AAE1HKW4_9NEOP|nr:Transmembrane protein 69 [Frankliniella fusca]